MDIRYTGKNLKVTQGIKDYLEDRLSKIEKYAPRLVEAHAILKKEKYNFIAEVTVLGKDLKVYGEERSKTNIFAALDQATVRVEKQLKKYREKRKGHSRGRGKHASLKSQKWEAELT